MGISTADPARELEDTLTLLAAQEDGIPERWVRPCVRRVLRSREHAAAPG